MKEYIYIKYNRYYIVKGIKKWYSNRLLIVGILKKFFGFKLFFHWDLSKVTK
jgi:hypothetical protein